MHGTWRQDHLPEIVATLANRPGHESVRTLITDILHHGFGVDYHAIDHEVQMPEVHGRADSLKTSLLPSEVAAPASCRKATRKGRGARNRCGSNLLCSCCVLKGTIHRRRSDGMAPGGGNGTIKAGARRY
jgi:hypothetical protein